MTRARSGKTVTQGRKRLRKLTKGYRAGRHNLFRQAVVTRIRAGVFAFRDRKAKKRVFRRLWILRINAAARREGLSYNQFVAGCKKAEIDLDRKVLADLAVNDPAAFKAVASRAKAALEA